MHVLFVIAHLLYEFRWQLDEAALARIAFDRHQRGRRALGEPVIMLQDAGLHHRADIVDALFDLGFARAGVGQHFLAKLEPGEQNHVGVAIRRLVKARFCFETIAHSVIFTKGGGGGLQQIENVVFRLDLKGSSFSFGLDRESRYSRRFALHMPLTYNSSAVKSSTTNIQFTSVNFEPYLTFTPISQKKVSFEIGAGVGLLYSL